MRHLTEDTKTVLVAVDYSTLAAIAVEHGVHWASQQKVESLHFIHVAKSSAASDLEREAQRKELQSWLSKVLKSTGGVPEGVQVTAHLVHGQPATSIVQLASDLLADLVILGTHGRTGIARMAMGSVAESVVRSSGCPVLVAREKSHHNSIPQIEAPCPRCVQARIASDGEAMWCQQHNEKHGRRHTYYNTRTETWVSHRIVS